MHMLLLWDRRSVTVRHLVCIIVVLDSRCCSSCLSWLRCRSGLVLEMGLVVISLWYGVGEGSFRLHLRGPRGRRGGRRVAKVAEFVEEEALTRGEACGEILVLALLPPPFWERAVHPKVARQ